MMLSPTRRFAGTWISDNATSSEIPNTEGTWTFIHVVAPQAIDYVSGCHRPRDAAWYFRSFSWHAYIVLVPLYSVLSSLANRQPWRSKELLVMTAISCASYAANKAANLYIFNRSDVVSAAGALVVGLCGNIYSRWFGGTAFTSMVTGVLFLVPVSGLSVHSESSGSS